MNSGTPLSWYNGDSFTLTWGKGTQLASAKKGAALKTSYTYDMAGVRSGKTVGTTKYEFTTLSGLVMRQAWGARQMDFVYDENNQPYAVTYKSGNKTPVMYYYRDHVHNRLSADRRGETALGVFDSENILI